MRHVRIKSRSAERRFCRGGAMINTSQPTYCGAPVTSEDIDRVGYNGALRTAAGGSTGGKLVISETCESCVTSMQQTRAT